VIRGKDNRKKEKSTVCRTERSENIIARSMLLDGFTRLQKGGVLNSLAILYFHAPTKLWLFRGWHKEGIYLRVEYYMNVK
jgi:hypothetical protein